MANKDWFKLGDFVEVTKGFYQWLKWTLMHRDEDNNVYALDVNEMTRFYIKSGIFKVTEVPAQVITPPDWLQTGGPVEELENEIGKENVLCGEPKTK